MARQSSKPVVGIGVLCGHPKPGLKRLDDPDRVICPRTVAACCIEINQRETLIEHHFRSSQVLLRLHIEGIPLDIRPDLYGIIVMASDVSALEFHKSQV